MVFPAISPPEALDVPTSTPAGADQLNLGFSGRPIVGRAARAANSMMATAGLANSIAWEAVTRLLVIDMAGKHGVDYANVMGGCRWPTPSAIARFSAAFILNSYFSNQLTQDDVATLMKMKRRTLQIGLERIEDHLEKNPNYEGWLEKRANFIVEGLSYE